MNKMMLIAMTVLMLSTSVLAQSDEGMAVGPAPNSGDGVPDGSGMDTQQMLGDSKTDSTGPAPNSGDGVPDGSGMEGQVKNGLSGTVNILGKSVEISEDEQNRMKIKSGNVYAYTTMQMTQHKSEGDETMFRLNLSNGNYSEVKIMPDTASEKALERLRVSTCSEENSCSIELKEVGSGEELRAAYEVQLEKQSRFLGIFSAQMRVNAQIDAESGEVINEGKPWWAFLATESDE